MIYDDLVIDKSIDIFSVFITLDFSIAYVATTLVLCDIFLLGISDVTLLHSLYSKVREKTNPLF